MTTTALHNCSDEMPLLLCVAHHARSTQLMLKIFVMRRLPSAEASICYMLREFRESATLTGDFALVDYFIFMAILNTDDTSPF